MKVPVITVLNLPLISEFAYHDGRISTWGNHQATEARLRAAAEARKQSAPRWNTKEVKRLEIERERQQIENRRKAIDPSSNETR